MIGLCQIGVLVIGAHKTFDLVLLAVYDEFKRRFIKYADFLIGCILHSIWSAFGLYF